MAQYSYSLMMLERELMSLKRLIKQAQTTEQLKYYQRTIDDLEAGILLLNSENEKSSQSSQGHGSNSSNAM